MGALCVPVPTSLSPGFDTAHKPCPLLPHGTPDTFCTWEPQESTQVQSTMDFLPETLTMQREELASPHQDAGSAGTIQSGRQVAHCSGTGRCLIRQTEGGAWAVEPRPGRPWNPPGDTSRPSLTCALQRGLGTPAQPHPQCRQCKPARAAPPPLPSAQTLPPGVTAPTEAE